MDYKNFIRDIPDFPKKGIIFKDLTTLWKDKDAFASMVEDLSKPFKEKKIDKIVGIESRGFILGSAMAYILNTGFVPIRKAGKLPADTLSSSYSLEYGKATIEIHKDAINKSEKILLVDDLLATGGTTKAAISLIEKLDGNIIACVYAVELDFLNGRKEINYPVHSLIHY